MRGSVNAMLETEKRERDFILWVNNNISKNKSSNNKTGEWYSEYLRNMGLLLSNFGLSKEKEFNDNFFEYSTYDQFKEIYKSYIGQDEKDVIKILSGKNFKYPNDYADKKETWNRKVLEMKGRNQNAGRGGIPDFGTLFKAYLKFLFFFNNSNYSYPLTDDDIKKKVNSIDNIRDSIFLDDDKISTILSVLNRNKNIILSGAPGVGKTFMAKRLAYLSMSSEDDSRIKMVQFHQNYSYEDFIEGYRPKTTENGFELKSGPFVKFAKKANSDPERKYYFIIDEINRGNISKIFGELMFLIEPDKRGNSIDLLYSNESFSVPENLYIIGMMNTADHSLAVLDYALRRRFSFFDVEPAFDNIKFKNYIKDVNNPYLMNNVIETIKELNKIIKEKLGKGFMIGHSYFIQHDCNSDTKEMMSEVIEYEIIPLLSEYWYDNDEYISYWSEKLRSACSNEE